MSGWPESLQQEHPPNDWIIEWPNETACALKWINSLQHSPLGIHCYACLPSHLLCLCFLFLPFLSFFLFLTLYTLYSCHLIVLFLLCPIHFRFCPAASVFIPLFHCFYQSHSFASLFSLTLFSIQVFICLSLWHPLNCLHSLPFCILSFSHFTSHWNMERASCFNIRSSNLQQTILFYQYSVSVILDPPPQCALLHAGDDEVCFYDSFIAELIPWLYKQIPSNGTTLFWQLT